MAAYFDKPMRRGSLISPFGVGAMVDFPRDAAVMIAGLDAWPNARSGHTEGVIHEERLQARLGVNHFRLPPDFSKGDKIPAVRFPQWHYCPKCRSMDRIGLTRADRTLICRFCENETKRKNRIIPVRFVTVCAEGHIGEFPFYEWAHSYSEANPSANHRLRYSAGKSSTLGGVRIACDCGQSRTMQDAFSEGIFDRMNIKCKGQRPWFGESDEDQGCGQAVQSSQRGASNIYFPIVYSSIYLPLWGEKSSKKVVEILETPKLWDRLTSMLEDGKISKMLSDTIAESRGVDENELYNAACKRFENTPEDQLTDEESFRSAEYDAFLKERGSSTTDLYLEKKDISAYSAWMASFFKNVVLVKKLRETRVLAGFTRLLPRGEGTNDSFQPIQQSPNIRWRPATIVRGEGIFFEFNDAAITAWIALPGVRERIDQLEELYRNPRGSSVRPAEFHPKFFLLHTFAHSLIRQLCFDCGYGSASLRERIYCDLQNPENPMQGVLIYTSAGDSEGTMGGLVRQAEKDRLELSIQRALQDALWCAADPICISSVAQGTGNTNRAACHNCVLIAETSCEQGNRYLDRAMLIGVPDKPALGFFSSLFTK